MLTLHVKRIQVASLPFRTGSIQTALPVCCLQNFQNGAESCQQTRSFRFGLWSSYLDPDYQKEVQKRQRQSQKKFADAMSRQLSWDRQTLKYNKRHGSKGPTGQTEAPQSLDDYATKSKSASNLSTQGGAIRVDQNPMQKLLKTHNEMIELMINAESRIFGPSRSTRKTQGSVGSESSDPKPSPVTLTGAIKKKVSEKLNISSDAEASHQIDPITNRRVYDADKTSNTFLSGSTASDTMSTLESWLSPAQSLNPFATDPMRECLNKYEKDEKEDYNKPVYYREPDGKIIEEPCIKLNGLEAYDAKFQYGPVYHNEPDGQPEVKPILGAHSLRDYDLTHSYGPVLYREPDGKLPNSEVKTGLEDFDTKAKYVNSRGSGTSSQKRHYQVVEEKTEDLDLLRASDVIAASGVLRGPKKETEAQKISKRQQLEEGFQRTSESTAEDLRIEHSELLNRVAHARGRVNAKIEQVQSEMSSPPSSRKLTGNYVRDFPEDFATSWTSAPTDSGVLVQAKPAIADVTASTASSPTVDFAQSLKERIEPALNRSKSGAVNAENQSISKTRTQIATEKQNHKDLVREIRQIYEETYGVLDSKHRATVQVDAAPASTSTTDQPVLYKILAYDPTMQSISEAETTSIATDSATPLTPAEVLLRLSNPAKFFPHFAPLQAKGFEILTGGGDVLVFRKVRDDAEKIAACSATSSITNSSSSIGQNPIDGMRPIAATGNFASPTGFVNYDLPSVKDGEPQFKSNIDVRREEPVFSGKRNWEETTRKKKSGRGKKILIGAAWVGACSYAVGVVAEFFKTGGAEGFPKGF